MNSVKSPTLGSCNENSAQSVSVAFCPVVTIVLHCGSCCNNADMSVGRITSRYLSDALSCNRLTAVAVSNRAIPFSFRKSMIRSLRKAFWDLSAKWSLSLKNNLNSAAF